MRFTYLLLLLAALTSLALSSATNVAKAQLAHNKSCAGVTISATGIVSASQISKFNSNFKQIRNMYNKENRMEGYMLGTSSITTVLTGIAPGPAVYMLFAILSILGWLCYIMYCVCECICPPCKKCCKCCRQERPYNKCELGWPLGGTIIFLLWVAICCIIGLTQSSGIQDSYKTMNCATISVFTSLTFGDMSQDWKGVSQMGTDLTAFATQLDNFFTQVSSTFGNSAWVATDKTALTTASTALKNPFGTIWNYANNPANSSTTASECVSVYFKSQVFNDSTAAVDTLISGAISSVQSVVKSLEDVGTSLKNTAQPFKDAIASGNTAISNIVTTLTDQIVTTSDTLNNGDDYTKMITMVLNAIYGALIGIAGLCGVALIFMIFLKWYKCRVILHGCWCLFCIIMIITFILCGIFTAISIMGFDVCEVINKMLNTPGYMDKFTKYISKDISDKMTTCKKELGGDGDILSNFGVQDQLTQVQDLQNNLTNFGNQTGSSSQNSKDIDAQITAINTNLVQRIQNVRDSSAWDTTSTTTVGNTLEHAQLQATVNTLQTSCAGSYQDTYAFRYADCSPAATAWNNTVGNYCFWIGGAQANSSVVFTNANNNTRYTACTAKQPLVGYLATWREDKYTKSHAKVGQAQTILTNLNTFKSDLATYTTSINAFLTSANTVLSQFSDTTTGILAHTNCKFLGKSLDYMYDGICVSFITNFWVLTKTFIILSFGLFLSAFFLFCTAMRFSRQGGLEEKYKQVKVEGGNPETQYAK